MKAFFTFLIILILMTVAFGQDAIQRLEKSPRHQEWIVVSNVNRSIHCFVVYPEVKEKATVVIVIHENKGLTDWVRGVADQLAEVGFIAIAPDLLAGPGPGGGRTSDFANEDAAREAISKLKPDQVMSDLNAVADYAIKIPAGNGKLTVGGFCWGGGSTFRFATLRSDLKAAFVFYGTFTHTKEDLTRIKCPVYGFYGGDDGRINATLSATTDLMKQLGKTFEPVTYDGAGHGFMRTGEDSTATPANREARNAAWERWKKILKEI